MYDQQGKTIARDKAVTTVQSLASLKFGGDSDNQAGTAATVRIQTLVFPGVDFTGIAPASSISYNTMNPHSIARPVLRTLHTVDVSEFPVCEGIEIDGDKIAIKFSYISNNNSELENVL